MATTSPDNLRTPNPGDPYNLVPDLATLASDTQAALITRANRYIGTNTQMNATAAPNGTEWYNTTDGAEYIRRSGAWLLRTSKGQVPLPSGAAPSSSGSVNWWNAVTVSFGRTFPGVPQLITTPVASADAIFFISVTNLTSSGFTYRAARVGNTTALGGNLFWEASI